MMGSHVEDLRHGADVVSLDGRRLGTLHAIVLDPRDNRVTHIAVNAGPHFPEPGYGSPNLVSVDIDSIEDATDQQVKLRETERQFKAFPPYAHTHFIQVPPGERQKESALPRLWNTGLAIGASLGSLLSGIAVPGEHFRKAPYERHILNDAPVWRTEPSAHIGDVEHVLIDETSDDIEALVIKRGILFREEVIVPARYVTEITDGVIHVQMSDEEIARLEKFRR